MKIMLTADYICGFVDGEGCFYILNSKRIACEFQVSQKEKAVLNMMQEYFGCGYVKPKYDRAGTYVYLVKNILDLATKIVPFFEEHPLVVKNNQFKVFAQVVRMQFLKLHLTMEGKTKITLLKLGTSETIRRDPEIVRDKI